MFHEVGVAERGLLARHDENVIITRSRDGAAENFSTRSTHLHIRKSNVQTKTSSSTTPTAETESVTLKVGSRKGSLSANNSV